jgi:hypothetical protein
VRSVFPLVEADDRDPFVNQARVLSRAEMTEMVDPAGESEIKDRSAATSKPRFKALSSLGHDFELHRPAGLLLDHSGAVSNMAAAHHIADFDLHKVTAAQLAVDRKIEQRAISQTFMFIEEDADGPNVASF